MLFDRRVVSALVCTTIVLAAAVPALAQPRAAEYRLVAYHLGSGPLDNAAATDAVVFSHVVEVPGAEWLRLTFNRAELGVDSHLRLTALEDGARQHLYPAHLEQWEDTSAYFNGAAVLVELVAGPGTSGNVVELGDVLAGTVPTVPETQCGPTDDRVPSDEPERARLLNIGCTAWMYNEESCFATAGHCVSSPGAVNIVEFNVPLSDPNGSINHPGPEDQYAVDKSEIPANNGGVGNDWGIFRVFPNTETGLMPFEAQGAHLELATENPPVDDEVNIVGYGVDQGTANQTQQISFGPITTSTTTVMQYRADTEGGNSGSGVVWETTGEAVAIHTHGGCTTGGGANQGTAISHPALQAAIENFCPTGGGGGVACEAVHVFKAVCKGSGANQYLLTGVLLEDTSYDGETVSFRVDGLDYDTTVVGRRAILEVPGATSGNHEVVLTDPFQCVPPKKAICP